MVAREELFVVANGTNGKHGKRGVNRPDLLDMEIAERVDIVRSLQERIESLSGKIQSVKDELRSLLEEKGTNWKDDEGYAALTQDTVRFSYDTRALDDMLLQDPDQNGWLKTFRRESVVRGTVKVK